MKIRSRGKEMKLKQYKLKRELPTFKAGSEFIVCCGNLIEVKPDGTLGVCAYSSNTLKKFPNILTDWFEEVKEPLIKDEKIRKAVRAWAEVNDITEINVASSGYELWGGIDDWCIHFGGNPFKDIKPLKYTIEELCGEEKE